MSDKTYTQLRVTKNIRYELKVLASQKKMSMIALLQQMIDKEKKDMDELD